MWTWRFRLEHLSKLQNSTDRLWDWHKLLFHSFRKRDYNGTPLSIFLSFLLSAPSNLPHFQPHLSLPITYPYQIQVIPLGLKQDIKADRNSGLTSPPLASKSTSPSAHQTLSLHPGTHASRSRRRRSWMSWEQRSGRISRRGVRRRQRRLISRGRRIVVSLLCFFRCSTGWASWMQSEKEGER